MALKLNFPLGICSLKNHAAKSNAMEFGQEANLIKQFVCKFYTFNHTVSNKVNGFIQITVFM